MALNDVRAYYEANPLMVSSPFGGVDSVDECLFLEVMGSLAIDLAGRAVLDVGCGRGFLGKTVEAAGGTYTGIDLVASGNEFRLTLAEAARLPFHDNAFDAVFCVDAFEHLEDDVAAATEFRRVLRPGGCVFLSVPNYSNVAGLVKWVCERWGGYDRHTWAPFRNWQPQELEFPMTASRVRRTFRSAGFGRLRRIGFAGEVGLGLFPWVEHAKMPEAVKFRLQKLFAFVGPAVARIAPGTSLHAFWRIEE